jgi:hypothetical protein
MVWIFDDIMDREEGGGVVCRLSVKEGRSRGIQRIRWN